MLQALSERSLQREICVLVITDGDSESVPTTESDRLTLPVCDDSKTDHDHRYSRQFVNFVVVCNFV
jgi:hypothetical protein